MKQGRLGYDETAGRYGLLISDLYEGRFFHCGDRLQVELDGNWIDTRIEMEHPSWTWYLVGTGLKGSDLEGIRARIN